MSDYERMQAWADAAKGHPTWSVAYAEDVPVLLAEVERLQSEDRDHALRKAESDLNLCRAEVVRLRLRARVEALPDRLPQCPPHPRHPQAQRRPVLKLRPDWTYGFLYRKFTRLAHRFGFCRPSPVAVEPGFVWCHWCGMRGHMPPKGPKL